MLLSAKPLTVNFAAEVVADGNGQVVGLFETPQGCFYRV